MSEGPVRMGPLRTICSKRQEDSSAGLWGSSEGYFAFLPPIDSAGFPASEFEVAKTFGFSCFGFLASLFPRLLFPLPMVCPSKMQRPVAGMAMVRLRSFTGFQSKAIGRTCIPDHVGLARLSAASSNARCCPRDTVVTGDPKISFAAAKSSGVSISVQFRPVMSSARKTVPFSTSRA